MLTKGALNDIIYVKLLHALTEWAILGHLRSDRQEEKSGIGLLTDGT